MTSSKKYKQRMLVIIGFILTSKSYILTIFILQACFCIRLSFVLSNQTEIMIGVGPWDVTFGNLERR